MSCGAFTEIQFVFNTLIPDDLNGWRILDVGCGYGFFGWALRAHKKGIPFIIGVDINEERLLKTRKENMYDESLIMDVRKELPEGKFELIIVSHLIEHLDKTDGLNLIRRLKEKCDQIMIVTCPEGDTRTPYGDFPPHDNHISVWNEKDLKKLDFKTRHMRFSNRAGRVVSLFERLYFFIKRLRRGGVLIGWWNAN